jgi:hypothetical protein
MPLKSFSIILAQPLSFTFGNKNKEVIMSEGTFKKVGESTEPMYGPRAMLICGFTPSEQKTMIKLLDTIQLKDVPVIFATDADTEICLCELLTLPNKTGRNTNCDIERAVVLSGITERELQQILSSYKGSGLPRPFWATLTPFSENWALSTLMEELKKERIAMEKRNR